MQYGGISWVHVISFCANAIAVQSVVCEADAAECKNKIGRHSMKTCFITCTWHVMLYKVYTQTKFPTYIHPINRNCI